MTGFVAIDRAILTHPVVGIHHPERMAAWVWMICQAAWQPTRFDVAGSTITVERGQFVTSLRRMGRETGLTVKQVRGLLARLERDGMCQKTGIGSGTPEGTGATLITICNYDKFQSPEERRAQVGAQVRAQQGHTEGTARAHKRTREQGNKGTRDIDTSNATRSTRVAGGLREGCESIEDEFDQVWQHYPRKVKRAPALAAWKKARKAQTFDDISRPLGAFIRAIRGSQPRVIPHLSSWLNQERWTDEPSHARNAPETTASRLDRLGGDTGLQRLPNITLEDLK